MINAGLGKTRLAKILKICNKKFVEMLPDKIFESHFTDQPLEFFRRKVWFLDDLITSFRGLSTKQFDQLVGMLNALFSKGEYERQGKTPITGAKISADFYSYD